MSSIVRILALATALVPAAAAPRLYAQTVRAGSLESSDPKLADGKTYDEYTIDATAGTSDVALA